MKCERSVIAEAVERAPARHASGQDAVLTLVEERARLLSAPRRGEVAHTVLVYLYFIGHRAVQQLDVRVEPFLAT